MVYKVIYVNLYVFLAYSLYCTGNNKGVASRSFIRSREMYTFGKYTNPNNRKAIIAGYFRLSVSTFFVQKTVDFAMQN